MKRGRLVGLAVASVAIAAALPSSAAETSPLSTLSSIAAPAPKDPRPVAAIAGIVVKDAPPYPNAAYVNVEAATSRGYCFASREYGLRLSRTIASNEEAELWRLDVAEGKTTLERTLFAIDKQTRALSLRGKSTVALREIARGAGDVVVWAFREGSDVIVLAKGADGGIETSHASAEDGPMVPFVSSDCAFGAARIDARAPEKGAVGQLAGSLPARTEAKRKVIPRFVVDVSVSRVSRDPEPKIAARVRTVE